MNKPLVVIVGETASGKSGLAMEVARQFDGEIISADSWAIYRGMDVGTAKPSKAEQAEIPHHLIDVVDPDGEYTAAVFKDDALKVIDDIHNRGKLPVMVGGTGLYVDAVLFDFGFLKTGDRQKRQKYDGMTVNELVQLIEEKGYDLTAVDTRNKRRLIRVLESEGETPTKSELRANTLIIGLKVERATLRSNIEKRVEGMFRRGLKKEVLDVAESYGWDCEGMQGIGYKEFIAWHEGQVSMTKVKANIVQNTLHLAKRQRTWFKRNRHIQWVKNTTEGIEIVGQYVLSQIDNKK